MKSNWKKMKREAERERDERRRSRWADVLSRAVIEW